MKRVNDGNCSDVLMNNSLSIFNFYCFIISVSITIAK